jgi:hypothetical protein
MKRIVLKPLSEMRYSKRSFILGLALKVIKKRSKRLFIRSCGACDPPLSPNSLGSPWHDLALTPKDGGQAIHRRTRYVDIWRSRKQGDWKLWMYVDNRDVADSFQPAKIRELQNGVTRSD